MKTNFFKIVLPAFALMLAITASLAFTPTNNEAVTQERGYIQILDSQIPPQITNCQISVMCHVEVGFICTLTGTTVPIFGLVNPHQVPQLSCTKLLYKIVD